MQFEYKVNLDVKFECPLLGVDTTISKRNKVGEIVKEIVGELLDSKKTTENIERVIDVDGIKGLVKCSRRLGSAKE